MSSTKHTFSTPRVTPDVFPDRFRVLESAPYGKGTWNITFLTPQDTTIGVVSNQPLQVDSYYYLRFRVMSEHLRCDQCDNTPPSGGWCYPQGWCSLDLFDPKETQEAVGQSLEFCSTSCLIEYFKTNPQKGDEKLSDSKER